MQTILSIKNQSKPIKIWKLAGLLSLATFFIFIAPAFADAAPDLRTSGIVRSVTNPTVDQRISFNINIKNFGNEDSNSSRARIRIDAGNDGSYETDISRYTGSLDAGESKIISLSWTARFSGTHRIEVCADINNSVSESNESNNCLTNTFNVTGTSVPTTSVDIRANGSDGPINLPVGSSVSISWTVSNASSCFASSAWSGTKSSRGSSQTIRNLSFSQTFTITCDGVSDSVTVNINSTPPPSGNTPSIDIRAIPSSIDKGESSIVVWNVLDADRCVASGAWSGTKSRSGNRTVRPRTTSHYILTCSNDFGSNSNFATVGVDNDNDDEDLAFSFRANPTSINRGESVALVWATTNTDVCVASGGWSGKKADSGADVVSPSKTTTYTLSCSGGGEISTLSRTVSVNTPYVGQPYIPPTTQAFNLACAVSTNKAVIGQRVTFAAGETGGQNPINFTWTGAISGNTKVKTVSFASAGFKNVQLSARDSSGRLQSANCSVNIVKGTVASKPPVNDKPLPEFLSYGGLVIPEDSCSVIAEGDKPLFASIFSPQNFGFILWYIFLILLNIALIIGLVYSSREVWKHYLIPIPLNGKNGNGNGNGNGNNYEYLSSPRL